MKAEAKIDETTVEIDTQGLEKRLLDQLKGEQKTAMEAYFKENRELQEKNKGGKGVVETYMPNDKKTTLIEEFRKGERLDPRKIAEQWTIAVPYQRGYETAGHLRDYVFVTDVIKGKPGDIVNIPYVKDLEFAHLTAGTGTITATTGLVSTLTTTLHESGAYYDAYYSDIEKIDSNLLDELNAVMAHAAIRAEDQDLLALLDAGTTSTFGETLYGSDKIGKIGDYGLKLLDTHFKANWIADAIFAMMKKGKDVHPGECILYLTPVMWNSLMREILGSAALNYSRGDVTQKGIIEDFLGVKIIVGGWITSTDSSSGIGNGGTTYQCAYLMRPKRCLALAPKRDILIETDKIIASRTLRIVATHAYGVACMDMTEAVRIHTGCGGGAVKTFRDHAPTPGT